jgi:hypothetical protein
MLFFHQPLGRDPQQLERGSKEMGLPRTLSRTNEVQKTCANWSKYIINFKKLPKIA